MCEYGVDADDCSDPYAGTVGRKHVWNTYNTQQQLSYLVNNSIKFHQASILS